MLCAENGVNWCITVPNVLAMRHRENGAMGGGYGYLLHWVPSILYATLGIVVRVVVTRLPYVPKAYR